MSKLPEHVKNILLIFSLHELLILGTALIPYHHPSLWLLSHTEKFSSQAVLWFQYDALFYIHIAHHGYGPHVSAFYPLLPLLVAIVHNRWVALAVMQVVFGMDLWLFSQWTHTLKLTEKQANIALLLFALNPAAVFYSTIYPEPLLVGLWLLSLIFAQRQSYYWAAIAAAFASLAHPTGALIGVIPLWLFIKSLLRKQWNTAKKYLIWGSGIGIGLSSFMVYSLIHWHTMRGPWLGEKHGTLNGFGHGDNLPSFPPMMSLQ
ncbi:mannosyltransferase family protein [Sulfobacillus thermosulfidooxidans]|uniref:mannosyltransferase family protein n=1 Tax=Sulfobacillus thermosulfidooxidans TaxID=28034 RepID=UPI0002EBE009|nr:mannosyltransferase family protein [Sulfobacillus thermosulfidooxidans]